jgi:hypothetical protein
LISLLAWKETRLSINDRVRSVLASHVLLPQNDSMSSRVFAIRHEASRGNVHSTQAAFEHAVASDVGRHHAGLWISYIRFCHGHREMKMKAKDVFERAVRACPASKAVYMEAFGTLIDEMDERELRGVYSALCEKGMRVHVEMEEFVEGWKRANK